jgi:hypothetical protein
MRTWNRVQSDLSLRIRSNDLMTRIAHANPALESCLKTNAQGVADCVSVNKSMRYPLNWSDEMGGLRQGETDFHYTADAQSCDNPRLQSDCVASARFWFRALCQNEGAACDKAVAVMVGFSIEATNPGDRRPGLPVHDYVVIETKDYRFAEENETTRILQAAGATTLRNSGDEGLAAVSLELARRRIERRIARHLESEDFLAHNAAQNPALKNCLNGVLLRGCQADETEHSLELRDAFDTVVAGSTAAYDSDGHSCKHRRGTICPITAEVLFSPECADGEKSCNTATYLTFTIAVRHTAQE